jgi:neural Wiskott-Aldrich syndrome protein
MSRVNEPPTYSQLPDTQLLIIPSSNSIQFQDGYLGAEERSSVEGEVHVKGAMPGDWSRLWVVIHITSGSSNHLTEPFP